MKALQHAIMTGTLIATPVFAQNRPEPQTSQKFTTTTALASLAPADTALGIDFVDAQTGFALVSYDINPTRYSFGKTLDGGKTWTVSKSFYQGDVGDYFKLKFVDAKVGFIAGDEGILKTTDGGDSWQPFSAAIQGGVLDFEVLNENHLWILAEGKIVRTVDGGRSWNNFAITAHQAVHTQAVTLRFQDSQIGYLITENYELADPTRVYKQLWTTLDGGANWNVVAAPIPERYILDKIYSPAPGVFWMASNSDKVIFSNDYGARWWLQTIDEGQDQISDIYFEKNLGFILSSRGLYKTIDGGLNWNLQEGIAGNWYRKIEVLDANHVWLLSRDGEVAISTAE